jgi:hypothetical protein
MRYPGLSINANSRSGILPLFPNMRQDAASTRFVNNPGYRNLIGTALFTMLLGAASSAAALGPNGPADYRLFADDGEAAPPPFSETMADRAQCAGSCEAGGCQSRRCSRWTASADFILFERIGGANQTLVERLPRGVGFDGISGTPGVEALDGNAFRQGFSGGPRVGLIRRGDCGYDFELSYFQIDGWNCLRSIGPDSPPDWLVMRSPGSFIQTNQPPFDTQAMDWNYASKLYNAELNVRWEHSDRVTLLAGFRWLNLSESLVGALEPPTISWEPPFWNTTTANNLYGFQLGAIGKIFERGRFSIDLPAKAGIYDNNTEQTTAVSVIHKQVRSASASTNRAAFVGEIGLQCKYQAAKGLLLRAGYEAIWLEGVALAPGQIRESYTVTSAMTVEALGVNCDSGAFYHGATAGLEYAF